MRYCRNLALAIPWVFLIVCLCGLSCSKSQRPNSVQGKVLYKDQPLAGALVVFHPEGGPQRNVDYPVGLTKEDGTFSLTTGQTPGAAAGKYVVTVTCPEPVKVKVEGMSMGETETQDRFRGAYADPARSKIKIEIKNGSNQLQPVVLK